MYECLHVKICISFLLFTKTKEVGKLKGFVDISKYTDAILWGASMEKQDLPPLFHNEMRTLNGPCLLCLIVTGTLVVQVTNTLEEY